MVRLVEYDDVFHLEQFGLKSKEKERKEACKPEVPNRNIKGQQKSQRPYIICKFALNTAKLWNNEWS